MPQPNSVWIGPARSITHGRLDERYLLGHKFTALVSLPFLLDMHTELAGTWTHLYSAYMVPSHLSYANIEGMCEQGYARMPFKQCQTTSRLVGKSYEVAGKAGGALHHFFLCSYSLMTEQYSNVLPFPLLFLNAGILDPLIQEHHNIC